MNTMNDIHNDNVNGGRHINRERHYLAYKKIIILLLMLLILEKFNALSILFLIISCLMLNKLFLLLRLIKNLKLMRKPINILNVGNSWMRRLRLLKTTTLGSYLFYPKTKLQQDVDGYIKSKGKLMLAFISIRLDLQLMGTFNQKVQTFLIPFLLQLNTVRIFLIVVAANIDISNNQMSI